ncbi:tRNA 4-thiouridine(8) synthase ThiI [Patescibacteria group bacterium]|nr:tRNA 4-thiouridine(8) synthase ThiI [Patescibacteria group bacterium]MBU4162320.1 tRNA 4-thiouridine(8) synthase ThiI [Patescibacteria group bacterium]
MKKAKALVLLSGGLDSILTAKLLLEQKIEVEALVFKSCFFDSKQAEITAKKLGIKLRIIDFSKKHFEMVKNPKYGYGKNMNPCIDCHALMLKYAKEIMTKEAFDFVATGEVLGERPMSQNKQALQLIEKQSGLKGYLLRPLSAKLLEPTIAEQKGIIDRDNFLAIKGRSRKEQLALAKKWKIDWFPAPSGGCLLTDSCFSEKLKDLIKNNNNPDVSDINLLKIGRHFWDDKVKIIIGRNHQENLELKEAGKKNDILLEMKEPAGPTALIRGSKEMVGEKLIEKAKELIILYAPKAKNKKKIFFDVFLPGS